MKLLQWLADQDVTAPLAEYEEDLQRAEESKRQVARWQEAMPDCLEPHWQMMNKWNVDTRALRKALKAAYPDPATRVLELFKWYGAGAGPWSGYPSYEGVPETLLLEYPTRRLVRVLESHSLTPEQIEGAARYFAGYDFNKKRPRDRKKLPPELRQVLLEHSLKSTDEDKIERARKTFLANAPAG